MKVENLRVKLTKQMVENALLQLLQEKRLEKITVLELCERAQINRTTFYKYYGSPYDVLEIIIEDFFAGLKDTVKEVNGANFLSEEMLVYLMHNRDKCLVLLDCLPYDVFSSRLLEMSVDDTDFTSILSDEYSKEQKEYVLSVYRHGIFGLITYWMHQKYPMSPQNLLEISDKLSKNIIFK